MQSSSLSLTVSAVLVAVVVSGCGPTDQEEPSMTAVAAMDTTVAPAIMPSVVAPVVSGAGGTPVGPSGGASNIPSVGGEPEPAAIGPSYAATVEPVVIAKCATAGCHVYGGVLGGSSDISVPPVNMVLAMGVGYAALTSGPSVELPSMWTVGSGLDDSYLWHKLNDTHVAEGGIGAAMPIGFVLTAEELGAIQAWIEGGASP